MGSASEALSRTFAAYLEKVKKDNKLIPQDFVNMMEPQMRAAGYRVPKQMGERPEIYVTRDDAAGDFVLFSPFLRELRRIYPAAYIMLSVSGRSADLARCCPYVDALEVHPMQFNPEKPAEMLEAQWAYADERLLSHHFDMAFGGRLGLRSPSLPQMYLSGAKRRVGFTQNRQGPGGRVVNVGWDCFLTKPVPLPNIAVHDVDRDLWLLETLLQLPIANRSLEVWYLQQDREVALRLLHPLQEAGMKRFYAVVPTASLPRKLWPVERYIELLKQILEEKEDIGLAVLGGPNDKKLCSQLAGAFGQRAVMLAGKANFRVTAAILENASLYIGNDTGALHIAAAQRKPILSVSCFPSSLKMQPMSVPIRFAPYGVPGVICCPAEARGECAKGKEITGYGCQEKKPHCILGVKTETVLRGYRVLQKMLQEHRIQNVFIK